MPNVFVPMHQPLLSRSQSPRTTGPVAWYAACLLFSPRSSHPLVRVSALSVLAFLSDRNVASRKRAACPAAEMRVTGIKSARSPSLSLSRPHIPPFLFPADSSSSPSSRHDRAGLRAFLMLNVAFCLCGYMGDSGERWSPGQRFFQMLNARFVPTHPVCPCYVASTGLPGTSQRTRQLRGLVIGVTRHRGWSARWRTLRRCRVPGGLVAFRLESFPHRISWIYTYKCIRSWIYIYVEIYIFQIVNDVTLPRYITRIIFMKLQEIRRKNTNESYKHYLTKKINNYYYIIILLK